MRIRSEVDCKRRGLHSGVVASIVATAVALAAPRADAQVVDDDYERWQSSQGTCPPAAAATAASPSLTCPPPPVCPPATTSTGAVCPPAKPTVCPPCAGGATVTPLPVAAPSAFPTTGLSSLDGGSLFERLSLSGNIDGKKTSSTGSTEGTSTLSLSAGPSYVRRFEGAGWGYYLEAVGTLKYDAQTPESDSPPHRLNLVLSGPIDVFGSTEAKSPSQDTASQGSASTAGATSGTTSGAASQSSLSDELGKYSGSFAKLGYKRYFGGDGELFAFGEAQVAWDTAQGDPNGAQSADPSYAPDMRALVGPGYGRLLNVSSAMHIDAFESVLLSHGILAVPIPADARRELEIVYDREHESTDQALHLVRVLRERQLLRREPTLEDSIALIRSTQDALRFRLKGTEVKTGLLVPVSQSPQTKATNQDKKPIAAAGQVVYTRPVSNEVQFTAQGYGSFQTSPVTTAVLSGLGRFDYKISQAFQTDAYASLTAVSIGPAEGATDGTSFAQLKIVGQANFFVAEHASWQTTAQATTTRQTTAGESNTQTELRLQGNFTYTF